MKVLFNLLDAGIGGGQSVALDVARELARDEHAIGLLVPDDGPAAEAFAELGAAVHRADLQTLRRTAGVGPAARIARGFGVLYSHTSVPGEVLAQRAADGAGIAHVVHRHTVPTFSAKALIRAGQRRLYRRTLGGTPFIAVAPHVAVALGRLGMAPERTVVIPNGIDVEAVRRRAAGIGPAGAGTTVGALGRLDPSRGLDVFVDAVRRVQDPDVHAVIGVASGPFAEHEAAVRRAAARTGVEIREPGTAGVEFLAALDVVVVPSRHEGSPLTLLEAMALGKPVVASDIPGIAEVLGPADAGELVPPGDPAALAMVMAHLVADPRRRADLATRGRRVVQSDHRLDRAVDRAVAVLEIAIRG